MIVEPQVKKNCTQGFIEWDLVGESKCQVQRKISISVMYLRRRNSEQYLWLFPSTLDLQMCHPVPQKVKITISWFVKPQIDR
jgi:hypothetical protein